MSVEELEALLLVQEHDTARDRLRHRRAALPERAELEANATPAARAREVEAREVGGRRDAVLADERRLDDEARSIGSRADEVNTRLYSGTTNSPKELQAMQADIDMLKRHRSDLEDQELEVMEARETLDAELAIVDAASARLTAEMERLRAMIAAAEAEIDAELAVEDEAWAKAGRRRAGIAARRLPTPAGPEQGRGRGPARRHVVHRVPPVDPVDGSRADPPGCRRPGRVLRQLRRDPRPVTQASLPFAGDDAPKVDELLLYCDGGSRGNPGPSAIGAVVFDATTDPPELLASVSECIGVTTNNVAEYKALIAGLEAVAHLRAPRRARARRLDARDQAAPRRVAGEARELEAPLRRGAQVARGLRRRRPATRAARGEHRGRRARERGARRRGDGPLMVLWLAFGSIFGVWNVFQSPGLDFRLIVLGALLPLAIDAPFRSQAYAHTLLSAVIVLVAHDGAHRRARSPAAPPPRR